MLTHDSAQQYTTIHTYNALYTLQFTPLFHTHLSLTLLVGAACWDDPASLHACNWECIQGFTRATAKQVL